jgi:L-fuconolactonase
MKGAVSVRIDSHQHFWHYTLSEFGWIGNDKSSLKRDYLPDELQPLLTENGFDGTVIVEARQSLAETEWLLSLADQHDWIKGVVGWVDLQAVNVGAQLNTYTKHPKFKGVRHVLHDEIDDYFMLRPAFLRGLGLLYEYRLSYDILIFSKHLPIARDLVKQFPLQRFVVDHMANPPIKDGVLEPWAHDIRALARFDHVYCKLSGMITNADWDRWQPSDFHRYLDVVFDCFGPDRLMIGSDWPVCTVAGPYEEYAAIVSDYIHQFPVEVQNKIMGENAERFYRLT